MRANFENKVFLLILMLLKEGEEGAEHNSIQSPKSESTYQVEGMERWLMSVGLRRTEEISKRWHAVEVSQAGGLAGAIQPRLNREEGTGSPNLRLENLGPNCCNFY